MVVVTIIIKEVDQVMVAVRVLVEHYEIVRAMFRPDMPGGFDYRPALEPGASAPVRLGIMAGAIDVIDVRPPQARALAPFPQPHEVLDEDSHERLAEIMASPVDWAPGLPLAAEGWEGQFYRK